MSEDTFSNADIEDLAELLREAEKAHAAYEKHELGGKRDENWARWYAEFIAECLQEEFGDEDEEGEASGSAGEEEAQ